MFRKNGLYFGAAILFIILMLTASITYVCAKENKIEGITPANDANVISDPVKTDAGLISGKTIGETGKEVRAYLGIPYAAPPVGNLRWKPPQPVVPWSGVRDATQYSKTAAQSLRAGGADGFPQDEDCLYLNVITPAKYVNEKLPVMVWFHGGAYTGGSGNDPLLNSHRLPQQGVIVVTVNMRVGVLGLLAHPLLSAESSQGVSGNYMFLDMLASLEWVKKNIAAFGGDPDNVTIFGQSSGGWKVATLVASPLGKGLFKRGICQSGASVPCQALSSLEKIGKDFFEKLGITTLEEARKISWEDIVKADASMDSGMGWTLAIDGWVINDNPEKIFAAGRQNHVQMMTGLNQGELPPKGIMVKGMGTPDYVNILSGILMTGKEGYAYIFDHVPVNWKKKGGKAVHGLDLLYLFGDYDYKTTFEWGLAYQSESPYGIGAEDKDPMLTETDKKVSEEMMAIWAQFAKTGNPSVKGLITVPPWEPGSDQYLYIADPLQIKSGFSNASLPEDIAGTWQGKLVTGHGADGTILFKLTKEPDGSYSAILNSPDEDSIIDIRANSVDYDSDSLKLYVAELSASYEGIVKDEKIEGEWKQGGISFQLSLSPYDKPQVSKEDMDKLLGTWWGKPESPSGVSPDFVFRFESNEKDEFEGSFQIAETGTPPRPVTNIEMKHDILSFKTQFMEFKGKFADNEIVGEINFSIGPSQSLTLKKGEYAAPIHNLNLPEEIKEQLLGEWTGQLTMETDSITETVSFKLAFRFKITGDGEFVGFVDLPDQETKGLPVTKANVVNGNLTLISNFGEFYGKLSGDSIVGDLKQGMMSNPFTLIKEKP